MVAKNRASHRSNLPLHIMRVLAVAAALPMVAAVVTIGGGKTPLVQSMRGFGRAPANSTVFSDALPKPRSLLHAPPFVTCVSHRSPVPISHLFEPREHRLDVVATTLADLRYEGAFANWVIGVRNAGIAPLAVATDNTTEKRFNALRVACLGLALPSRWNCGNGTVPRDRLFLVAKIWPALMLTALGKKVIFSEMDIFWLRNPRSIIDTRVDLQVSQHAYEPDAEVNFGFFVCQPTTEIAILLSNLYAWSMSDEYHDCMDQKVFDFAIRGPNQKIYRHCWNHMATADIRHMRRAFAFRPTLRWAYIPYGVLPHSKLTQDVRESGGVVAVHLWSSEGSPAVRVGLAKRLGFWNPPHLGGVCAHGRPCNSSKSHERAAIAWMLDLLEDKLQ
jgi:hypothetical protein